MQPGLSVLNRLPREQAFAALLRCCGSRIWADRLADERPFVSIDALRAAAKEVWWKLEEVEWLEAFAAHPKIGDPGPRSQGDSWARKEQQHAGEMAANVRRRLTEANEDYRERFGFIFIICATGKSAAEMLESLESRLGNDRNVEIRVAAEQQELITELRLSKLLAELEEHA